MTNVPASTDTPAPQNFDPVTVPLLAKIEHDGETYSEFTFREAELGDLCAADAVSGEMQKTAAILAGMAGVPIQAIRKLKARDLSVVTDKVGHLMGNEKKPTTGAT